MGEKQGERDRARKGGLATGAEPVSSMTPTGCLVHGVGGVTHCVVGADAVDGDATVDAYGRGLLNAGEGPGHGGGY
jgi:hypothetical protein